MLTTSMSDVCGSRAHVTGAVSGREVQLLRSKAGMPRSGSLFRGTATMMPPMASAKRIVTGHR